MVFFTKEIMVDKGVCWCPLAPLLFALASQPLISLLKREAEEGFLQGIPIGEHGEQLLYQVFADDTNFF